MMKMTFLQSEYLKNIKGQNNANKILRKRMLIIVEEKLNMENIL